MPNAGRIAAAQRRTLVLLATTQVLGGVGVAIGIAVGALLAADLAGTDALAGVAATAAVVGAAVLAIPISRVMDARGRRPGLVLGYAAGAVGAGLVVVAALFGSFVLGMVGLVLFGGSTASSYQARYAATDLAKPDRRAVSLSTVVWATTIGSVVGPNLAEPTGQLVAGLGVPSLAGPFLLSIVVFVLSAVLIAVFLRPDPLKLSRGGHTAAGTRASSAATLGLGAVAVGHAVMVGIMAMTPVHLRHGGASLQVIGLVISTHVAGMFALSPVVGWLTDRLGRRPVIGFGVVLLLAAAAVAGTAGPHSSVRIGIGLGLLGLGWSCTLVAGSTLLTESVPIESRPSVQGAADFVMGLAGAASGLLSGLVVGVAGYSFLALLAAIAVLPLAAATLRRPVAATGGARAG